MYIYIYINYVTRVKKYVYNKYILVKKKKKKIPQFYVPVDGEIIRNKYEFLIIFDFKNVFTNN